MKLRLAQACTFAPYDSSWRFAALKNPLQMGFPVTQEDKYEQP